MTLRQAPTAAYMREHWAALVEERDRLALELERCRRTLTFLVGEGNEEMAIATALQSAEVTRA